LAKELTVADIPVSGEAPGDVACFAALASDWDSLVSSAPSLSFSAAISAFSVSVSLAPESAKTWIGAIDNKVNKTDIAAVEAFKQLIVTAPFSLFVKTKASFSSPRQISKLVRPRSFLLFLLTHFVLLLYGNQYLMSNKHRVYQILFDISLQFLFFYCSQ